ncbi:MAG: ArsA family ATPase [Actinomycetota bacterium]|nr:ArsA family ATPase [Actinomycetota bacterium]
MRVLLFTGKGGVGKTTASAATATLAALRGRKTLVLSTDPAHSLADALGVPLGPDPTEVDTGLYGMQVDAQRRFEQTWAEVAGYLRSVLETTGVDPIQAEELTVLPGAEEVLALLEVRSQVASGRWDVVIVDCAPTAETLRLLALPEALNWYVERVFPAQRRAVRSLRPVLSRLAGAPMPHDQVFVALERLHHELGEVRAALTGPAATIRLVLTPESIVVAEARRMLTSLSLHGYRVDGVLANRVFPAADADPWRAGWVASQSAQLDEVRASFAPLPVHLAPYRAVEPVGPGELAAFATEVYAGSDPLATPAAAESMTVVRDGKGFTLSLVLPLAERRDVDLARSGDELVVTVAGDRRLLALPSALRRCTVSGAALADGRLQVSFRPDPDKWMR